MADLMLKDMLDWDKIMIQPRYAGGHTEIMESLFKDSMVIAEYCSGDYQGMVGYIYAVWYGPDFFKLVVLTDYYGSCSGCDSWEDADDESVKNMCVTLANNAHMFDTPEELEKFLGEEVPSDEGAYWDLRSSRNAFEGV